MGTVRWEVSREDGLSVIKEIHRVVVYRFRVTAEDPDLYAADPIYKWQQTDQGRFVMEHALNKPEWHRNMDHSHLGYDYIIVAELEMKKLSEFYLRWGPIEHK